MNVLFDSLRKLCPGLLFCSFCLTPGALFAKDAVPDWVRTAAAEKLPSYPADTNSVVLFDDVTYSVAPDGKAVEHVRRAIKILRPQGRDDGTVYVPFDGDRKILSMHVWSISPDGHEFEVDKKEFVEFGYPGQGNLYEDMRVRAARPAGRDPGGIISETTWFFQDDSPRLHQRFTLELPAGFTYSTVWAHHAAMREADPSLTSTGLPAGA